MALSEPLPVAGQLQALLADLTARLSNLPVEQRIPLEADLQKIKSRITVMLEKERETSFSKLFEKAASVVSLSRLNDGSLVNVNDAWVNTFGFAREEALGRSATGLGLNPDLQAREYILAQLRAGQPVRDLEMPFFNRSGEKRFILASFDLVEIDGEMYILSIGQDITFQRRAAEQVRRSEEKFAKAFNASPVALAISTVEDGRFVEINDTYARLYGFSREEVIGHTSIELGIITPEDRQKVIRQFRAGNGFREFELKGRAKSGEARYTLFSTEMVEIEGKPHMLSVIQDITERKLAESFSHALNEINQIVHSSLDFREVLNGSIAAASRALGCDTAAISLRYDGRWHISGGYGFPEDILGIELDDNQERHAVLAIQTKQPVPVSDAFNDERFNREHLRKWGIRSVLVMPIIVRDEAIGVMFFNYQQSAVEFKQYHIDFVTQLAASLSSALVNAELYQNLQAEIEERKMIETRLRDSETRERERANELEAVMDAAPAVIWISRDPECREMTGNRYSYDILRIRRGENVSKTAPDQDLAVQHYHMEIDGREVQSGEMPMQIAASTGKPSKDYEFDLVYEDGTRMHLFGNVNPLLDADGKPYGAIGVFVDLTSMRRLEAEQLAARAEIEVQRRLMNQREQERQAIARDLHDGPIQTLSSSVFHLQMIKEIFPDPALQVELNQIGLDIKNTVHELRGILNDLRPPALMHFGFSRVLRLYTEDLRERYPSITIDLDVADDDKLLSDQARLALFRIYQAGINNIVRHSGATQAWVSYQIEQDTFRLELRDNGQGFSVNGDFAQLAREGHFGLVGMKERAEAIGAQFTIISEPGSGARIVVTGPLAPLTTDS